MFIISGNRRIVEKRNLLKSRRDKKLKKVDTKIFLSKTCEIVEITGLPCVQNEQFKVVKYPLVYNFLCSFNIKIIILIKKLFDSVIFLILYIL